MNEPSSHDTLSTGRANGGDEGSLLALINSIQPHVPWSSAHFRWQYLEPPLRPANLYVIRSRDTIVALYAAIPQRFWWRGEIREAWMIQDVMTRPEFRGKGFLHQLGAMCLDELRSHEVIGYTFPNELSERSFRRNGWTELSGVPARRCRVDSAPRSKVDLSIEPWLGPFDESATEIWRSSGNRIGVMRDQAYLNWRYSKPDQVYYRFRIAGTGGLLVLKVYSGGDQRAVHILEILVKEQALLPGVLRFCFDFAVQQNAGTITAWLSPAHRYAPEFDQAGLTMETVQRRFVFVTGPRLVLENGLTDPGRWHLTQGDSDIY